MFKFAAFFVCLFELSFSIHLPASQLTVATGHSRSSPSSVNRIEGKSEGKALVLRRRASSTPPFQSFGFLGFFKHQSCSDLLPPPRLSLLFYLLFHREAYYHYFKEIPLRDWRDGSGVKGTCCSSRESEFGSQRLLQVAHKHTYPQLQGT